LPPAAAAAPPPPPPPLPAGAAADVTVQWQIDVMTELAEIKTSLGNILAVLQDRQHGTGDAGRQDWARDGMAEWRRRESDWNSTD